MASVMVVGRGRSGAASVGASVSSMRRFSSSSSVEVEDSVLERREGDAEGAGEESDVSESERDGSWLSVEGVVSLNGPLVFRFRAITEDMTGEY